MLEEVVLITSIKNIEFDNRLTSKPKGSGGTSTKMMILKKLHTRWELSMEKGIQFSE